MRNSSLLRLAPALTALLALSPALQADDLPQLRDQIHALEKKLLVLERRQEIQDERVAVADKGFTLASADGANAVKIRGLVQLDHRLFSGDNGLTNNSFVLRRARLVSEGTFAKNYNFQLVTEFGGSSVSVLDANFGINVSPALQFRIGKFKSPVGLEQLQSDSWTFFNERSIVTNLVPNRDIGVQASGDLAGGWLNYTVGIFGGVADGASTTNADFDNEKDVVARVIATPFKNALGSPVQGLAFGVSASVGREKTAAGRSGSYRTDGQQTFFSYLTNTVADGRNWRVSPQLDYRNGSFGLLGEYVISTVNVRPSAIGAKQELQNKAWQVAAGYVLTGETSSYAGVVPRNNFDFAKGTWGAFEIVGRYANLKIDDAAFPLFASPAASANEASSFGLGLNWYLSKAVLFKIDYYHTRFGFAPSAPAVSSTPALRQDEQAFITRFQLSF